MEVRGSFVRLDKYRYYKMKRKIYMIGDSIMQTNKYDTYPQTGWGQVLYLFTKDDVEVINLAKNGTSTKSFIDQNRFDYVRNNIAQDDLLIVSFAHNDEKINDPSRYCDPYGKFIDNLTYFINVAKSKNAQVILSTPVVRRKFEDGKLIETHQDYVDAIKKCASLNGVPYVDLNKKSKEFFQQIGDEASKSYFMHFEPNMYENFPLGHQDDSHLRFEGAILIAKFFVEEVYEKNILAKEYFSQISAISCARDTYEN